jgi:hypothetical protein
VFKDGLQTPARRDFERILTETSDVTEYTEKKDADAHVADIVTDCRQSV